MLQFEETAEDRILRLVKELDSARQEFSAYRIKAQREMGIMKAREDDLKKALTEERARRTLLEKELGDARETQQRTMRDTQTEHSEWRNKTERAHQDELGRTIKEKDHAHAQQLNAVKQDMELLRIKMDTQANALDTMKVKMAQADGALSLRSTRHAAFNHEPAPNFLTLMDDHIMKCSEMLQQAHARLKNIEQQRAQALTALHGEELRVTALPPVPGSVVPNFVDVNSFASPLRLDVPALRIADAPPSSTNFNELIKVLESLQRVQGAGGSLNVSTSASASSSSSAAALSALSASASPSVTTSPDSEGDTVPALAKALLAKAYDLQRVLQRWSLDEVQLASIGRTILLQPIQQLLGSQLGMLLNAEELQYNRSKAHCQRLEDVAREQRARHQVPQALRTERTLWRCVTGYTPPSSSSASSASSASSSASGASFSTPPRAGSSSADDNMNNLLGKALLDVNRAVRAVIRNPTFVERQLQGRLQESQAKGQHEIHEFMQDFRQKLTQCKEDLNRLSVFVATRDAEEADKTRQWELARDHHTAYLDANEQQRIKHYTQLMQLITEETNRVTQRATAVEVDLTRECEQAMSLQRLHIFKLTAVEWRARLERFRDWCEAGLRTATVMQELVDVGCDGVRHLLSTRLLIYSNRELEFEQEYLRQWRQAYISIAMRANRVRQQAASLQSQMERNAIEIQRLRRRDLLDEIEKLREALEQDNIHVTELNQEVNALDNWLTALDDREAQALLDKHASAFQHPRLDAEQQQETEAAEDMALQMRQLSLDLAASPHLARLMVPPSMSAAAAQAQPAVAGVAYSLPALPAPLPAVGGGGRTQAPSANRRGSRESGEPEHKETLLKTSR